MTMYTHDRTFRVEYRYRVSEYDVLKVAICLTISLPYFPAPLSKMKAHHLQRSTFYFSVICIYPNIISASGSKGDIYILPPPPMIHTKESDFLFIHELRFIVIALCGVTNYYIYMYISMWCNVQAVGIMSSMSKGIGPTHYYVYINHIYITQLT